MKRLGLKRIGLGAVCGLALVLAAGPPAAQGAFDDPLFVLRPEPEPPPSPPLPPPSGVFEGACGVAVDAAGQLYVSDYYHHAVELFGSDVGPIYPYDYKTRLAGEDPLDGPCALAMGAGGRLYVNNFHRNVVAFTTSPFDTGTVIAGAPLDDSHPTGVAVDPATNAVYVNERTHVAVFDSSGVEQGQIGSFGNGYGLAISGFPATEGYLYVADAATETVKVYDPATDTANPIATIDGSGTPVSHFVSLRDAAIAVDDSSGEVYVADDLQPEYTERAETVVYVFGADGTYEGRLKFAAENSLPPGLAVDNSATASQGRVYLTSGNTERASVYVYPPHAATINEVPLGPNAVPASGVDSGNSGSGLARGAASGPVSPAAVVGSDTPESYPQARTASHRLRRHRAKHRRRFHVRRTHR